MADREHHGIHAMTIEGTPGHGDTFYRCTQCDVQAEREYHWLREKSSESVQK